jgi:putative Holliday junction resolvase
VRRGVRVAVDVGTVRIGVAASDPDGLLASPVETVRRGPGDLDRIATIVAERAALEVYVGLPVGMSGREGAAAAGARGYAARIAARVAPTPVRLVDERLTTVVADRALRTSSPRTGARRRRNVIDQVAAALILEAALAEERTRGAPPGERLA